ncbi:C10 family peptidase [Williamwhitmania taraxaci]|uniref:Por secretion system C-terminal sorting domain-containing protein n=1 Tax=Williamwhitmania taraxaci TaxID=1640674 RepID=A0A1G6H6X9_9BACT|nr:C10 family peptidase [Williamwhitmania taraxaci]SDB89695.1 Por secretion system C-terminal sorting domain-containing protein [Williamwhitmania taraxaci]
MKRKFLLSTALLFLISAIIHAAPVSVDSAKKIAFSYLTHQSSRAFSSDFNVEVVKDGGVALFYVFNFEPTGFVIVAADDAVIPVLGYSFESKFDLNRLPENAKSWFDGYKVQINNIVNSRLDNSITKKEWTRIEANRFSPNRSSVAALCTTTWDQGQFYNAACPSDASAPADNDGRVYTGCVATAMAQIMKYNKYPATGISTHSYTHPTYGIQSVDYGASTYNWNAMPSNVTSPNAEVAKLMYHCGVSVDMNYAVDGSGAQSSRVPNALISLFGYSPTAEMKEMSDFSASGWISLLKSELDAARPMYYAGDDGVAGHAFVCDGYDATDKFHFNWGWSGYGNGFFAIGSLNPVGSTFNQGNEVVVRIKPASNAPIANFTASAVYPEVGGSVSFTDKSTLNPTTWTWTFEGGSPATSTDQNPQNITYAIAGSYLVSLKVTNASGNDIKTMSKYILVGGSSDAWIRQNTGFTAESRGIDQIKIVSPLIVWAKAYDGTGDNANVREFTRTTDGGITWTPGVVSFSGVESYGLSNIFPLSDLVCYACMNPGESSGGKIVKTIDGGITWTEQSSATFDGSWANFVHFFNNNDGVAMGDPATTDFAIYTTSDGGNNWLALPDANIPNIVSGEAGVTNMYYAVGNTIWFSSNKGRVFKSIDKGLNWTVVSTGLTNIAALSFKDASTGFAILSAAPYTIKKTMDGGSSWSSLAPTGFFVKASHFAFLKGTDATWVDVSSGPISGSSFSLNDCATFNNIDTGKVQYTEVEFLDRETGWAGSFTKSSTIGGIYKWNYKWLVTTDVEPIIAVADKMRIYPNPASGSVYVAFSNGEEHPSSIIIYNMVGSKVREIVPSEVTSPYSLNIYGLKTGIYLVSVVKEGRILSTQRISIIE